MGIVGHRRTSFLKAKNQICPVSDSILESLSARVGASEIPLTKSSLPVIQGALTCAVFPGGKTVSRPLMRESAG
jgi:hypothetical protein